MGALIYGAKPLRLPMEDRLLAHLQLVIVTKFRRNEPFLLSWNRSQDEGGGRGSLWLHPSVPIQFEFSGNRRPALNRTWLEQLTLQTATATGLELSTPEPEDRGIREGQG